jgi:hypothetical protein
MVWCDDDVLLAFADLADAVEALRVSWRKYSGRARLEHVSMLCDARMEKAFELQAPDEARAAVRDAFVAIVALGQVLLGERELRGTAECPAAASAIVDDELEAAWRMVGVVLDVLAPYVSDADQVLRRVLLEGELLDDALARLDEERSVAS